jgi:hypothetical protein
MYISTFPAIGKGEGLGAAVKWALRPGYRELGESDEEAEKRASHMKCDLAEKSFLCE